MLAGYLSFVHRTSRVIIGTPGFEDWLRPLDPMIIAMWHGQHFMIPFARPDWMRISVLIALHGDAEINAVAAQRLGLGLVRGSGARGELQQSRRKRSAASFLEMLKTLRNGSSISLTADVPVGPDKIAGHGIVLLARHSGRPIIPVAVVNQHRLTIRSWDRAAIPLPFGRMAYVVGPPITVPADADENDIERFRLLVKEGLDQAHYAAYEIVDGHPGTFVTRPSQSSPEF